MEWHEYRDTILAEIKSVMLKVEPDQASKLMEMIVNARRIFLAGCGRSGLMARAFAMRLMHLGYHAHVVGETAAPAIGIEDLLIVCSGSGSKHALLQFIDVAHQSEAHCAAITAGPDSPVAASADAVVVLPIQASKQFGGSIFEQSLLIFLDTLVLMLAAEEGITHAEMAARHANLE